jgi:hypothetical protein
MCNHWWDLFIFYFNFHQNVRRTQQNLLFQKSLVFTLLNHVYVISEHIFTLRIPWPDVCFKNAFLGSTSAFTSIQESRQIFGLNVLKQLLFVTAAQNFYLLFGLVINPHFDDGPNPSKEHRGIHNEHAKMINGLLS